MGQSSPMNGGDGIYSYTKNSTLQRNVARGAMDVIKEVVIDNLDIEKLLSEPSTATFVIADLGCSVGPNTFYAIQTLIDAVVDTTNHRRHSTKLEFQVLFNDQTGNDFNTLFASLPHPRNYFAAAVPGSFYGRLFPSSSIHIAYSSASINWLSKVPEAVQLKGSPAWNSGKIHYAGASDAVVNAYADQFVADMEVFLRARGEEIAPGGMIVMPTPGVAHRGVTHHASVMINFLESILIAMGVLEQELVDSFNIPVVYPCIEDMRRVIEKNGCFEIVKLELGNLKGKDRDGYTDAESVIMHLRAALEGTFGNHFGNQIADQLFLRAMQQKLHFAHILQSFDFVAAHNFFVALKRKSYTFSVS
ncbi:hypothetical protein C2S53_011182, partial [Perilla frutescens var. hirtella]